MALLLKMIQLFFTHLVNLLICTVLAFCWTNISVGFSQGLTMVQVDFHHHHHPDHPDHHQLHLHHPDLLKL